MTMAPNETLEGYTRKNELLGTRDKRELTMDELLELRELTRIAASHLVFSNAPARIIKKG